jgi:RHS repeat-associated protein
MAKTSTAMEVGQEGSLREGLETAIRERVREIIEMVLQEEVETALGAGRRIAWRDSSGNVYYYFADALGSTRTVTSATGSTCFNADYYPYGQGNDYSTSCSPTYKFTGYEYDSETGNYYAYARYYSPRLGRFMTADSLGGDGANPQSLNRYAYVLNNPASLNDPLGQQPIAAIGPCIAWGTEYDTWESWDNGGTWYNMNSWIEWDGAACPVAYFGQSDGGGGGGSSDGCLIGSCAPPNLPPPPPSKNCLNAIHDASAHSLASVNGYYTAEQNWGALANASSANGVDPALLAAVGEYETGFQDIDQGGGQGVGYFQIDLGQHPDVSRAEALDLAWSANYAAGLLSSNISWYSNHGVTDPMAQMAGGLRRYNHGTAGEFSNLAEYNATGDISVFNQSTAHGVYATNVLSLATNCFGLSP